MQLTFRHITGYFLLFLPVHFAQAGPTTEQALQWLNRMAQAASTLSYDGTFVYVHQDSMETMRIIHKGGKEENFEHLISLNGSKREVIKKNNKVTCFLPNNKQVVVEQKHNLVPFLASLSARIDKVRDYYDFELGDIDRVAGFRAQEVKVNPRDNYRFGYRLWLDTRNAMLLKSQLLNEQGLPIEQIMFTNFTLLASVPDQMLAPEAEQHAPSTWITDEKISVDAQPSKDEWRIAWLPEGFIVSSKHLRNSSIASYPIHHYLLSDGFASVSVFVERRTAQEVNSPLAEVKKGAISAYSTISGDFKVTTVGEVPMPTVKRIAQSVQYVSQAGSSGP
ncbi:MAG: MucB/RseB C-terminal domain-containing protein [Gammaproteobacteria bacterium]|nr:MucB/RseB C-terminal domain-containing protein [Gammaproteobacteria bacterium]